MKLKINEEFKNLIPSLTKEEYEGLEKSIVQDGCREKITVWNGCIIDGHNRYEICTKHSITFEVLEKENFETEADVKMWMINNQFDRRNLPIETRLALAYKFKGIEEEKARDRQLGNLKQFTEVETAETRQSTVSAPVRLREETKGKTLESIAKKAGVSSRTAEQYDTIQRKGSEEDKAKIINREASIKKVYTQIQRAERLATNKVAEWPKGKYRVIYADPPWEYGDERSGGSYGGAVDHYPTMSLQELNDLPVKDLTEDDAVLFMWATSPVFKDAFSLIESWGFKYKTQFVWDKVKHNMGHYNSVRHELLLIATKGSCLPDKNELIDSVQTIERTEKHSAKPEEFRNIIDTLYTYGNKIELFARKKVDGWDAYGNEVTTNENNIKKGNI